jgi:hypothetical protein
MAVAAICFATLFSVILAVPAPIAGEYWVRELIIIKRHIAETLPGPRILFVGGSSTLFGIDAKAVGDDLGLPAINMGLHAGMFLERLLAVAEEVARKGDVLVLPLEQDYYNCRGEAWNDWRLRNYLAWDRDYFATLPLWTRLWGVFSAGGPRLVPEIVGDKLTSYGKAGAYPDRVRALGTPATIWRHYASGILRTSTFSYSAYNIDERGTMTRNKVPIYKGQGNSPNLPGAICPATLSRLKVFVAEMRARDVRVLFGHAPYLVDAPPAPTWQQEEALFSRDIAAAGAQLVDKREDLFLPRNDFFNSNLHLTEDGRKKRTHQLTLALRRLGVGALPAPHPDPFRG